MEQPLPRADVRLDFVVGVAEHLLPARRVHDGAGLEVPVPDAFLRAGERQRQPLFALAQRRLGALALGDVPHDDLDRAALLVFELGAGDFDFGNRSVEANDFRFDERDRFARQQSFNPFADERMTVWVKDVERRFAEDLFGSRRADQPDRCGIHQHDAGILADEDAIGRQFHQTPMPLIRLGHLPSRFAREGFGEIDST